MNRFSQIIILLVACLPMKAGNLNLVQKGDSCMEAYDNYHALQFYEAAFKENDNPEIRRKLANCLYERDSYRRCADLLSPLPQDSLSHKALRQLFYCYKYLDQKKLYKTLGNTILERYHMDGEVLADLAASYIANDNPDKAYILTCEYYLKDSTNIAVNHQFADACFIKELYPLAATIYEKMLKAGVETYSVYYSLGVCHEQLKAMDKAKATLEKAVALSDSTKAGALYYLGYVDNELKLYNEATPCFLKALQLYEPDPSVMYISYSGLAESYYQKQNYRQASYAFKKALEVNPSALTANYYLGACYEQMNDRQNAIFCYNGFLSSAAMLKEKSKAMEEMISFAQKRIAELKKH
jgi:tetratricopeptide (TPR) repeat protein